MDRMTMNDLMDREMNKLVQPRALSDSESNQLAELRHEPCQEHCDECGTCDWRMTGPVTDEKVPMFTVGTRRLCEDCLPPGFDPSDPERGGR